MARVRPNSGEVQESAEREALAKVIKHKGKDRQLDKTVIIKNTPEAFRFAFHIFINDSLNIKITQGEGNISSKSNLDSFYRKNLLNK